jgi:hypothetical protein
MAHLHLGQRDSVVHIALCERDDCPWKHRGVTEEATNEAANRHANIAGHSVALYEDHHFVGRVL